MNFNRGSVEHRRQMNVLLRKNLAQTFIGKMECCSLNMAIFSYYVSINQGKKDTFLESAGNGGCSR